MNQEASKSRLHEGLNDPSPISRIIALDWIDGPVSGVLRLAEAEGVFRFEMFDQHFETLSNDDDVRVYGLYPVPDSVWDQVIELVAPYHLPNWPVWWPVWQFPTDEIRTRIDQQLDKLLQQAGPLSWVVVGNIAASTIRALPAQLAKAS